MYLIKKQVGQNTYYWNDLYKRWEGLEENATWLNSERLDALMGNLLLLSNATDYSFTKIN